jgi:multidrug transporter EmrE-like cation transporter
MIKKISAAAVLLSLFSGLAHAEGNYSHMDFGFLIYGMVAVTVLMFQMIFALCIGGVGFGRRALWVLVLMIVDAVVAFMLVSASTSALETPMPYIVWVIPGFIALAMFKAHASNRSSDATP